MIPIIYTQLFLVTISLLILTNNNQSRTLSVTDGYRPFHIIFKPGFWSSALNVRLRKVIVISVKTNSGNFEKQACFLSCLVWFLSLFFASFKQAELSVRWALRTKKKSFLFYRVFWRALFRVAMFISKRKLNNTKCIVQIKR